MKRQNCEIERAPGVPCGRPDLALSGEGPCICFVHLQRWIDERVARREVTRERFDARAGEMVEVRP